MPTVVTYLLAVLLHICYTLSEHETVPTLQDSGIQRRIPLPHIWDVGSYPLLFVHTDKKYKAVLSLLFFKAIEHRAAFVFKQLCVS